MQAVIERKNGLVVECSACIAMPEEYRCPECNLTGQELAQNRETTSIIKTPHLKLVR